MNKNLLLKIGVGVLIALFAGALAFSLVTVSRVGVDKDVVVEEVVENEEIKDTVDDEAAEGSSEESILEEVIE